MKMFLFHSKHQEQKKKKKEAIQTSKIELKIHKNHLFSPCVCASGKGEKRGKMTTLKCDL